ncbi:MAG: VCBS repeat-containing protein [Bacteroidota bacterium]
MMIDSLKHHFWQKLSFFLFIFWASGCNNTQQNTTFAEASGEELAQIYCKSCHAYASPSLLPKSTWKTYILPRMGYLMGIYDQENSRESLIGTGAEAKQLEKAMVYPSQPLLSTKEWQSIQNYILTQAPDTLPITPTTESIGLALFHTQIPNYKLSPPSTTLAQFANDGHIWVGDANTKALYRFGKDLQMSGAANLQEGVVHLLPSPQSLILTVMGSFSPTEAPTGFIMSLPQDPRQAPRVLLDSLKRPVHTAYGDLNGDGRTDLAVAEFARYTGKLAWYAQQADGSFETHILRNKTGATRVISIDIDGDQDLDLMALFAQGDEGIFLYENDGKGNFQEKRLLTFPPTYGSSYMEILDLDNDGKWEILYTCGDNADYPPVLKPYHGIRIFKDKGNLDYQEDWFYPLPGAYKAIPADFDMDGDLDFAAISFFPDYLNHPKAGFHLLENQGDFTFKAATFEEADLGRWLTLDAGDMDQDGDLDLVLGSLTFEAPAQPAYVDLWVKNGIPFVVLENQSR